MCLPHSRTLIIENKVWLAHLEKGESWRLRKISQGMLLFLWRNTHKSWKADKTIFLFIFRLVKYCNCLYVYEKKKNTAFQIVSWNSFVFCKFNLFEPSSLKKRMQEKKSEFYTKGEYFFIEHQYIQTENLDIQKGHTSMHIYPGTQRKIGFICRLRSKKFESYWFKKIIGT